MNLKKSICNKCSSCGYCANRESGMLACNNFNKFPKETVSYEGDYDYKAKRSGK